MGNLFEEFEKNRREVSESKSQVQPEPQSDQQKITGPGIFVKEYKSNSEYQKEANNLFQQGYEVVSSVDQSQRIGCARGCLLGLFSLVWRPKSKILVTYKKAIK